MNRKYRDGYGTVKAEHYDRMVIQPPVFKSVADAYIHFVRHPEERQVVEDSDVFPNYSPLDDFFDRYEEVGRRASAAEGSASSGTGAPSPVPSSR